MFFLKILFKQPRVFALLLIFIFLSGIFALNTVPRQENPELAQRWSTVQTIYPGASPARVETQILEPMEAKLREVYELNEIISFASQGFGTTVLEIKDDVSPSLIEQVWSEVQDKLDQSLFDLPEGLKPKLIRSSGPPTTLLYSLTWAGEGEVPLILLSRIAEDLRQSMAYVAGSDRSAVFGSADEEVLVEIDNAKLSALGLTFQEVAQSLSSLDTKKPIGQISNNGQEFLVKSQENLTNLSEVSNLPIKVLNEYEIIRLGDIANLSKNPRDPPEELTVFNGQRAVLVEIRGAFSQRVDLYVESIESMVDDFKEQLPSEIVLEKIYDESYYFKEKFNNLYGSILFATLIVIGISYFLLGFKSAIIVGSIIPLTIFLVLFGCKLLGLPLHQTSMTGIIIALGLLIDNAIIVVEDYKYRRSLGNSRESASYETFHHLWIPLSAATATTALSFFPIAAGQGPSAEFVGGMAKTVILSITASLFLALYVVPLLLNYINQIKFFDKEIFSGSGYSNQKLLERYRAVLTWAYAVPKRGIMIAMVLPMLGFLSFPFLKADFFPALDRNMFKVLIELPQNSNVSSAEKSVLKLRESILESGIVVDDFWFIGRKLPRILYNVIGGDSGLGDNNVAQGVYIASSYDEMIKKLPTLAKRLNVENPDLKIIVDKFDSGPPVDAAVEYSIDGPDLSVLRALGKKLELILRQAPDVYLTKSELSGGAANLEFKFSESDLAMNSISGEFFINELAIASEGIKVGTMIDGNKEIPIKLRGSSNNSILSTQFLSVPSSNGFDYSSNYGEFEVTNQANFISRDAGKRQNQVAAWIWPGLLPSDTEKFLMDKIIKFEAELPPGYILEIGGEADARGKSQSNIFSSAILFFVLIVIALVSALNSFRQATLILSVAIWCTGLAFLGLTLGQANFGFMGLVGAIGLAGLSINDSIVVLSHIKEANANSPINKNDLVEVIIRSTRHVVTTSATTIGGFIPLLVTSIFFEPLAWAMAGGVIGSTVIAIFYIPACYAISKKL
ncbi:MAG: AcrB/AcrD/AcrF family protein [SAR86 cluster bacterium]|uniref:AcrB/AcrD/AcrF family protein n=1 Tax=SAR86 cluster bacterium TaxID=2030880 RepID=A0A368BP53_9GAMM|nr:MAG: AcrB/AcrD/AcrF family protein [SAR86 cluster bacterium]|tara:strand:- start:2310 stop:5360 length:3051 start_codon:yes stop_codon:yes gene_type:complete